MAKKKLLQLAFQSQRINAGRKKKTPAVPDSHRLGVEPGRVVLSPLSLEMDEHKQMLLCKTNIIRKQDYLAVNVFDVCLSFSLFFFFP